MKSTHLKTYNSKSHTAYWFNVEMEGYDDEYVVVFRPEYNPHLINSAAEILTCHEILTWSDDCDDTYKLILSELLSEVEKITK